MKLVKFHAWLIIPAIWLLLPNTVKRQSPSGGTLLACISFTNYSKGNLQVFSLACLTTNELANHFKPTRGQEFFVTTQSLSSLLIADGGGTVTVDGDNVYLRIPIDLSNNNLFTTAGLYDPRSKKMGGGRINGTLYISYLFRSTGHSRNSEYSGLYLARQDVENDGVLIGTSWSNQTTSLRDTSTPASLDLRSFGGTGEYNIADNNIHLMVLKITYQPGMSNAFTAWLDPDPNAGEANQNSPTTFTGTLIGDGSFDRLFLHGGTNNPMDFGKIRLGTTWDVVLPPNHSPHCFPQHDFQTWPEFFAAHLQTNSIHGYTFLALDHGKIVARGSGGYYRLPPGNGDTIPWDTRRALHVASVSKSITATAVMKLWEEHHFSLDASFWPYLKDLFPNATDASKQITIRQLLTHRSGLTQDAVDIMSTARLLASLSNGPPGVRSHYNNLNYYILRLLIEKVSGEPYVQYVQNHVLKPAGANMDTKSKEPASWDATAFAGAIGWHASTSDLTAFLYGLSQGKILAPVTVEKMFHETLGWNPITLDGQIIGYHKNGRWQTDDESGEAAEIAHFVDGVDVALLLNSPIHSQARLLKDAWQLDKAGQSTGWTGQPDF